MDPMKLSKEEPTIANDSATDGTVTAVDSNGKPIAGRYPFRRYTLNDKKPEQPKIVIDIDKKDENHVSECADNVEINKNGNGIHIQYTEPELTPAEKAKAEDITISKCVKWMREHPKYTIDELREVKVGFAKEAQQEVIDARAKHDN